MSSGPAGRRLLDGREREWRPLLNGLSLVAEGQISPEQSHEAAAALGAVYASHFGESVKSKVNVFRFWPACVAVALAGVAATEYEYGAYWPALWEIADYDGSPQDQMVWGQSFAHSLERLDMPAFPGMHNRYVGPILMHAGIPSHCLGDLLRLLLEQRRRQPGLDADTFMSWALEVPSRLNSLDKPVQRFLFDGGDYAQDTIDRGLDLLDRLSEPEPDLFGIGLPQRLVDEAASLARRKLLDLSRPSAARSRRARPRISLDPFGEGPVVSLPPSDDPEHEWRVVVDGQPHIVPSYSAWPPDEGTDATFPIPQPVRQVQVSSRGDEPVDLPVIGQDDPLLVFAEDGRLLPPTRSLPRDVLWVLYPAERTLSWDGEMRVVCEMPVPFGWYGWVLEQIDLTDATAFGLKDGPSRKVHGADQPRLALSDPVPGITSTRGAPVYSETPTIQLPDRGAAAGWHVQIRDLTSAASPTHLTAGSGDFDPWSFLPRPITGTFDITVLGPLGYRLHRQVTIAEGLTAVYEPDVRLLTRAGLEPAVARLHGTGPVEPKITFDGQARKRAIDYGSLQLLVTPPHLQVLRDDGTPGVRWEAKPLLLTTESFARPGVLLVRGPAHARLSALQVGDGVQAVPSSGLANPGQARFELTRIKDTVEAHRRVSLTLVVGGRTMPVAWIRPRQVVTGVTLREHRLQLRDFTSVPDLKLGVYSVYAPWRGATVLPVSPEGSSVVPAELVTAGPLVVLPRTGTGESWPYWPDEDQSFSCAAVGWPRSRDEGEQTMARFVAGHEPLPDTPDPERLWLLCDLSDRLEHLGARRDLKTQCAMYLRNQPKAALLALAETRLSPEASTVHIIETGLAGIQTRDAVDASETRHLWARLPSAAALLTGRLLLRPESLSELLEVVVPQYGQESADLLIDGAEPYVEAAVAPGGEAVPPPPLAADRLSSIITRCASLQDAGFEEPLRDADRALSAIEEALARTPYAALTEHVAARPAGLTRLSIACALSARAGAWGRAQDCKRLERRHRPLWTSIARSAPDLVNLDLILAQSLVTGVERAAIAGRERD